jgi:glycosyltransferase involved in cell wall biosynthesis
MHIAYVSDLDARNVRSWSGSTWHMWNGLAAAGAEMELITPLQVPHRRWYALMNRMWQAVGRTYSYRGEPRVLNAMARQVETAVRELKRRPDVIFSCGKPPVSALDMDIPIVFADDGSVPAITKLYPGMNRLARRCTGQLTEAERGLLRRALMGTYASDWAADAARSAYPESAFKITSVPWGANIECHRTASDIEDLISARRAAGCFRVLFLGVDWRRKRGDLVVAACRQARAAGAPIELDLAGCAPPAGLPAFVRTHGFIAKSDAEGRRRIAALYEAADVLFVPSKAEAYGVVFAEASSYGVPSLSTAVGGIPSVVRAGRNGMLLPLSAPASAYASLLAQWAADRPGLETLARISFREYSERLNWKRFGETVLAQMAERRRSSQG